MLLYFFLYLIVDENNARQAEGHKASFCLEDSKCEKGVKKFFNCSNGGDQGVSINCADNYKWNIDCQWIDVSDVKYGKYKLRIVINPLRKIVESDYSNNIAVCDIEFISQSKVNVTHCQLGESFFATGTKIAVYSVPIVDISYLNCFPRSRKINHIVEGSSKQFPLRPFCVTLFIFYEFLINELPFGATPSQIVFDYIEIMIKYRDEYNTFALLNLYGHPMNLYGHPNDLFSLFHLISSITALLYLCYLSFQHTQYIHLNREILL